MSKETFSLISLGCFRNTYDSERVIERFCRKGFEFIPPSGDKKKRKVDILIINTCGFIDKAKEETLEVITEALALKKKGRIKKLFVFGCCVERYRRQLKKYFPQVDCWWGVEQLSAPQRVTVRLSPPHLYFLKISEGCLHRCSYCAIPLIKGTLVSRQKEAIIREVRLLGKKGVKELNIIGQDITSWGKDSGGKEDLVTLLRAILKVTTNIPWIRLLYTHPVFFTPQLIDLISHEERICKYIDLPIQHINDRILALMNRKIRREAIVNVISRIRKKIPEAVLRTSVIVGFPTESEKEFSQLLSFIKENPFQRLGAFIYSREENTSASHLKGQIHPSAKKRRFEELMLLQRTIAHEENAKFIGRREPVLIEEKEGPFFIGRTQYDAYDVDGVVFVKRKGLKIGDFYKVSIVDAYDYDLVAE